jgi:hypothetical protein
MPTAFKKGDSVRQVVNPIEGEVVDLAIVDGDVQFLVSYVGADGEQHQRYFTEAELQAVAG